jgi:hypothetical protein
VLFFVAFLFKRMFDAVSSANPFTHAMLRVVVLFAFWRLIDSFGVDWLVIDVLPLVAAVFIYGFFFAARRRGAKRAVAAPAPVGS